METQNNQIPQSQDHGKSNQQLTNSNVRKISLTFNPIERNSLLARIDDQTQALTTALANPGATTAEVKDSEAFSNPDALIPTSANYK